MGFIFHTPTIVGGTVLVIEDIESQNYVTTVSGWAIFADGTAEFLSITIRGVFISGTGTGKHIEINGTDAPNGVAFYTGEADETFPGVIQPNSDAAELSVTHSSPLVAGHTGASLVLATGRSGLDPDRLDAGAGTVQISSDEMLLVGGTTNLELNSTGIDGNNATVLEFDLRSLTNKFPLQSGVVLSAAVATFQTIAVVFPVAFSSTPRIVLTPITSADVVMQVATSAATATGFNLHFKRATAVATNIAWIATNT